MLIRWKNNMFIKRVTEVLLYIVDKITQGLINIYETVVYEMQLFATVKFKADIGIKGALANAFEIDFVKVRTVCWKWLLILQRCNVNVSKISS